MGMAACFSLCLRLVTNDSQLMLKSLEVIRRIGNGRVSWDGVFSKVVCLDRDVICMLINYNSREREQWGRS